MICHRCSVFRSEITKIEHYLAEHPNLQGAADCREHSIRRNRLTYLIASAHMQSTPQNVGQITPSDLNHAEDLLVRMDAIQMRWRHSRGAEAQQLVDLGLTRRQMGSLSEQQLAGIERRIADIDLLVKQGFHPEIFSCTPCGDNQFHAPMTAFFQFLQELDEEKRGHLNRIAACIRMLPSTTPQGYTSQDLQEILTYPLECFEKLAGLNVRLISTTKLVVFLPHCELCVARAEALGESYEMLLGHALEDVSTDPETLRGLLTMPQEELQERLPFLHMFVLEGFIPYKQLHYMELETLRAFSETIDGRSALYSLWDNGRAGGIWLGDFNDLRSREIKALVSYIATNGFEEN